MTTKLFKLMFAVSLAGIVFFPHAAITQQGGAKTIKIPDGTIVHVVIDDALSSETSHVNDQVHFEAAEDIKVGNSIAIAKGATGIGKVTRAEPKGRWGKGGGLDYSLDYIKGVDGSNVRLRATSTGQAKSSTGALMMGLSGGFKKGKAVTVDKGSTMDAYVDGDRDVALAAGQ
jgi:hypothetical protein